ncbi:hypothetical protein [Streptomyces justiciae]|uniref:Chaplin domain-containing protein n=1 Tax=Streptomyces justiciae TaxID=2780140 RepID=A0ABU3LK11_9ACTN|nr:hypothetical protein [Streptomyces justiciae]MDT7839156.1 hypothetical protein [Streptomyces justiciae]
MKKTLMAAVLASSTIALAAPAHADHGPDAHSGNHWGTAAPVMCTAEHAVTPVLGDLASAPAHACTEG